MEKGLQIFAPLTFPEGVNPPRTETKLSILRRNKILIFPCDTHSSNFAGFGVL